MRVLQQSLVHRWLISELTSGYPDQTLKLPIREIHDFVEEAAAAGTRSGAESINAIRKYVLLAFILGPRFLENDTPSWIRAIRDRPESWTIFEHLEEIERVLGLRLAEQPGGNSTQQSSSTAN